MSEKLDMNLPPAEESSAPQVQAQSSLKKYARWLAVCGCLLIVIAIIASGLIIGFVTLGAKLITELARWL